MLMMEVIWCGSFFIGIIIIINNTITIIIIILILMTNIVSEPAYFLQRPEDTVAVAGSDLLLACQVRSMCICAFNVQLCIHQHHHHHPSAIFKICSYHVIA